MFASRSKEFAVRLQTVCFACALTGCASDSSHLRQIPVGNLSVLDLVRVPYFRTNANALLTSTECDRFYLSPPGSERFLKDADLRKARTETTHERFTPQYISIKLPPGVEFQVLRLVYDGDNEGHVHLDARIINGRMAGLIVDVFDFFAPNGSTDLHGELLDFNAGPYISTHASTQESAEQMPK